jgi:IS1 family transposase
MNCGRLLKKQDHLEPDDAADLGDAWIWKAVAPVSRLRVVSHIGHERSEEEATAFIAAFKDRTDGQSPLFTGDKLPAYTAALVTNYSTPEPPPARRGPGRPRKEPRRTIDPDLRYGQVVKRRENGRVVEVERHIVFGTPDEIEAILDRDGCGSKINTAYVERDNLTSRQHNGRLVRKTLSHSKKVDFLRRQVDLEDAVFNFVRPHGALRVKPAEPAQHGRKWEKRTPAMAAGLTDHIWTFEELLRYRVPPKARPNDHHG